MTVLDNPYLDPSASSYSVILAGHLGYLSREQETAFATFKDDLTKAELYFPNWKDSGEPSHDDSTLLRFLRARKFDPVAAQKQFQNTASWRKEVDVDNLFENFGVDEMEASRKFYPRWTGRRDKLGVPVYVYPLAALQGDVSKELFEVKPERRFLRIVALWEVMSRFVLPLCTHLPHPTSTPICAITSIIDLKNVSLMSMWTLRNHLQEASKLATANYPETIHTIAIVNSPAFFPTLWGWIQNWFDEGTRRKIYVLGKDPGATLRKMIDAENLPKSYGGELDWTFGDEPSLDQEARAVIGEAPKGPAIFKHGSAMRPNGAPLNHEVNGA